jgi:hypothetical protein
MAVVGGALVGGMVIAWALVTMLGGTARVVRRDINRARGADRPEWAPGIWHCATCLTTNHPAATRCQTCRTPRRELVHDPIDARPDWIPEQIAVPPDVLVTLVHDPVAHADPSQAHWCVKVAGARAGTAARRAGALGLLRAIDGADTIQLDVRGTGPATFRLDDVIARFEAAHFPLDVPCPERDG